MSRNLVWTVNINNHMSENARQSISEAADRWGCDFLEIKTIFNTSLYPSFAKTCSFDKIEGYERAVYFDSDMLIHIDAPNPFEVFQDTQKFVAVLDIHPQNHDHNSIMWRTVKGDVQERYWHILEQQFSWGVSKERFLDHFFNSGFFIINTKRHKTIFKAMENALPLTEDRIDFVYSAHYEQALFNYVVQAFRFNDLYLAEETWNRLEPLIEEPRMTDYVWHFTGFNFWVNKHTIKEYNWRNR
jgi:lipopolysaccharide biosynthesis glycosyltransferase